MNAIPKHLLDIFDKIWFAECNEINAFVIVFISKHYNPERGLKYYYCKIPYPSEITPYISKCILGGSWNYGANIKWANYMISTTFIICLTHQLKIVKIFLLFPRLATLNWKENLNEKEVERERKDRKDRERERDI